VLGEFTIASLLSRSNLQVAINLLGKSSAQMSVAVSLAALVLAFVLLAVLSWFGRGRSEKGRGRSENGPGRSDNGPGRSDNGRGGTILAVAAPTQVADGH